jgi:predicted transglutaminase-like cysteine proteinase
MVSPITREWGVTMKIKLTVGGALLALLYCTTAVAGFETQQQGFKKPLFAKVYGAALPPVGYVNFCAVHRDDCRPLGGGSVRLTLTPERWNLLYQVNTYVNNKIVPMSDEELYGEAEHWDYPTDAGDCEDYLLLKKRYLEGLGFPPEALLITVVLDEKGEGHAVLTVTAETGDFVLDNRRNEILRWGDVSYRFLKRQSAEDPLQWLALTDQTPISDGNIAGDGRRK